MEEFGFFIIIIATFNYSMEISTKYKIIFINFLAK